MDKPLIFVSDFERKILEEYPRNGPYFINNLRDIAKMYNADYKYLLLEMNHIIYGSEGKEIN